MSDLFSSKDLLPGEWWAVAECVDAYESESNGGFPSLRKYSERAQPEFRGAALAELVKVDLERRWAAGDRRRVEEYLHEYPELNSCDSLSEIVQQEFFLRSRSGELPTASELRSRFPSLDERRVLQSDEQLLNTIAFGISPDETKIFEPSASESAAAKAELQRTGTVMFDLKKSSGSSINPSSANTAAGSSAGAYTAAQSAPASAMPNRSASPLPVGDRSLLNAQTIGESTLKPPAKPTDILGRYTIKRTLGSGSFGMVYHCFDEDLKRDVAIKVPHGSAASTVAKAKEFMHEAQSAARLKHPGIVSVMDTNQTADGRVFIVYEFIPGSTLQNRFEEGKYTFADAAKWIADVADALAHAHKNNIVHRDMKPANVLIDSEGKTFVADFGLAKRDDQFFKNDTGRVLGTVAYMSPEQAAGQSHWATPQTDIYALGVMLYQFLTRRLPFASAGSATEVLEQIQHRVPPPPRTIDEKIPPALEEVCLKAMAKSPADRYRTAGDMAADLRKAIAPPAPPARRGLWTAVAAGGAAAATLLAVFVLSNKHDDPPAGPAAVASADAMLPEKSTQEIAKMVSVQIGDMNFNLRAGTPTLKVLYQRKDEKTGAHYLRMPKEGEQSHTLAEGDNVHFEVDTNGTPRYVYLYWYDNNGNPERLWPSEESLSQQNPVAKISYPESEDDWRGIDATRGCEMALVFVRDQPLSKAEIQEFEKLRPYAAGQNDRSDVYEFASTELATEIHRGLGGIVHSRKNPVSLEFEEALKNKFAAYDGKVIPHQ